MYIRQPSLRDTSNPELIDTTGILAATADSIRFDPNGLSTATEATTIRITGATSYGHDSVLVNQLGKVVR